MPQLTMSREMAANIVYDMRILKGNVLGFSSFAQRLFPGWNTSAQKFAYMTALNQYLRDKIAVTDRKGERDWLFGCKKICLQQFMNIIRLEEAKVHPEDVKAFGSGYFRVFGNCWKYLEQLDNSIVDFRTECKNWKSRRFLNGT